MKLSKIFALLSLMLTAALVAPGVETAFWQTATFDDFLHGDLVGISLSKDGQLRLAPEARAVYNPEETVALSLAADQNQNLYLGTGHQGKVFRVGKDLKGSLFFQAPEPEIFALAVGPDGALYVGSSPEGKIYRVTIEGKSTVFYDPKCKYVWALAFDAQGRLYVGSGDRGRVFRVDATGKGEVFFESSQTHIMCLTLDSKGNVIAGSEPNGLIYRIDPQGRGFVLYQAGLPEIHALATDAQGRIYAAALGGAGGKGTPEFFAPSGQPGPNPTTVTTVTVEAAAGEAGTDTVQQPTRQQPSGAPANRPAAPNLNFPMPQIPQGRGSLIQILPDYTAETLWSSNNETIFGLALRGNDILFSTDSNGRIFGLSPSPDGSKLTLLNETHESMATRLLLQGNDLYAVTSNIAKLFRVGTALGAEGTYESIVKDTRFISRWGVLNWRGSVPAGCEIQFFTRSGNSERPDNTWSDWSGPYRKSGDNPILSPSARYIQWKAVFRGTGNASPTVDDVTVAYLNQNLPPQVRSLSVSTAGERTGPTGAGAAPSVTQGNVTVSVVGSSTFASSGPGGDVRSKAPVILSWQADDPNGDQLVYGLYLKARDETEWHLLKDKLRDTNYTLDASSLPDGEYTARLVASDEESNSADSARQAELVSTPFWIDNTPPRVKLLSQQMTPAGVELHFQAESNVSPLRSAEVSRDGKEWTDIQSDDGIVDSRLETFTVRALRLGPGERIVLLRAYDTAGNVGVGKAVVRAASTGDATRN
jgi:sugar lactone lactonase YvrE